MLPYGQKTRPKLIYAQNSGLISNGQILTACEQWPGFEAFRSDFEDDIYMRIEYSLGKSLAEQ